MAIWDQQAVAKPPASATHKAEEHYLMVSKEDVGRVVLNQSPLERSGSSG